MTVCRLYDRVGVSTATTGTGTVTLGAAISNAYFTFANAGVQDQDTIRYVIDDGNDFEIGEGVYTASGTTLTRGTVIRSNVAGIQGTGKLNLSGSATVRIDCSRTDLIAPMLLGQPLGTGMINGKVSASVASNALTLAIKTLAGADPSAQDPVLFVFRNATKATGDYIVDRVTAALSITVSSGATLGHVGARDQQIILSAIDNAGTVELAVSCKLFDQSVRLQSTTAISGSATDPTTMYSTAARTNVAWYPVARCVCNQTTAGTWTATPTQIDLAPFTLPTNACRIYLNASQTGIANSTHTKINFDTVDFDPDSIADVATNHRIQPKVPGTYSVSVAADCQGTNISGLVVCSIVKSGIRSSQVLSESISTTAEVGVSKEDKLQMNGTSDYFEMQVFLTLTAGTGQVNAGQTISHLSCARVGP
jgi:hypothetical protein